MTNNEKGEIKKMQWTKEELDAEVAQPDGSIVRFGDMTVEQHQAVAKMLETQAEVQRRQIRQRAEEAYARMQDRCPRCAGTLRRFPDDSGSVSRTDGATIICSRCGTSEALGRGMPRHQDDWPLQDPYMNLESEQGGRR